MQYYFPSLDDIFIAAIRRYSERGLAYLAKTLQKRADDPVRALWESSRNEATSALMTEFMALGNHRKNIRAEIAAATENARTAQLEALAAKYGSGRRARRRLLPVGAAAVDLRPAQVPQPRGGRWGHHRA